MSIRLRYFCALITSISFNLSPFRLYYTKILLGSPGRPYFLDIDTGSDLAWVQCDAPCTSCAKVMQSFNIFSFFVLYSLCLKAESDMSASLSSDIFKGQLLHATTSIVFVPNSD